MSSAILSVYLDSASDLPQGRVQSKPDPYVVLSVGKQNHQTAAFKRTDVPVFEQGFTFLVSNPENDAFQLRVVDQKTDKELGQLTYALNALLTKNDLQVVSQPFQLQKAGPTSKVIMSMALKILKRSSARSTESIEQEKPIVQRQQSQVENVSFDSKRVKLADMPQDSVSSSSIGEFITEETNASVAAQILAQESDIVAKNLNENIDVGPRQRQLSNQSSNASSGLGSIQISLEYMVQRQRLSVIVHKIL